jgi:hypothetical protein
MAAHDRGLRYYCDEGWLYLASVIDLASRHLLGYSMGIHHDAAWSWAPRTPRWLPALVTACPDTSPTLTTVPNTPRPPASGWGCGTR